MQKIILMLFLMLPFSIQAKETKFIYCLHLSTEFMNAASYRNMGWPPLDAFKTIKSSKFVLDLLGEKKIKKIVNLVYFDWRFTNAGGEALKDQVYNSCMGINQFEPLK